MLGDFFFLERLVEAERNETHGFPAGRSHTRRCKCISHVGRHRAQSFPAETSYVPLPACCSKFWETAANFPLGLKDVSCWCAAGTCTGMFWRDDPRGIEAQQASKPDWPRNGAVLRGQVYLSSSKQRITLAH